MIFRRYLARQLGNPSGLIGRFILGPVWNKRNAALNDVTVVHLDLEEADRVLDIGFGGGYLLVRIIPQLKQGWAAGIDASPAMVHNGRVRWRAEIEAGTVEIQQGRAELLPYPDGHFTKVSSVNSIFYWDDARQGISEIYRVLQDEGKVVLTYTCKRCLEQKGLEQAGVKTYDAEEIDRMLATAGFREIKATRDRDRHREFICVTGRKRVRMGLPDGGRTALNHEVAKPQPLIRVLNHCFRIEEKIISPYSGMHGWLEMLKLFLSWSCIYSVAINFIHE